MSNSVAKIPVFILADWKERDLSHKDIERMTAEELFTEYCNWHGLFGWGDVLINALDQLREAKK